MPKSHGPRSVVAVRADDDERLYLHRYPSYQYPHPLRRHADDADVDAVDAVVAGVVAVAGADDIENLYPLTNIIKFSHFPLFSFPFFFFLALTDPGGKKGGKGKPRISKCLHDHPDERSIRKLVDS